MRKLILLFLSCLFSLVAKAEVLTWNDLDFDQHLQLLQKITFENAVELPRGANFALINREPLSAPGVSLVLFTFKASVCNMPAQEAELTIVEIATRPDYSVGVELQRDCALIVYVEAKDYYSSSFF